MHLLFRETPVFTERAVEVLTDEELRTAQNTLLENPEAGRPIRGAAGLRKLRVALPSKGRGTGKSGGARVIYLYLSRRALVYLFYVYGKHEADDLSPAGRHLLAALARQYKAEDD
jgi:hypothetical protein